MYSYTPAKAAFGENTKGFPRVKLQNLPFITNNLNAAPKYTQESADIIKKYWDQIRDISRAQGCVEGVKIKFNREQPEHVYQPVKTNLN